MFKKLFCSHDYDIIKEFEIKSEFEIISSLGYTPKSWTKLNKEYVTIFKCKKCNKIKTKIISI